MNPPMVYELTKPSSQRTINTTAMVSSIFLLLLPGVGELQAWQPTATHHQVSGSALGGHLMPLLCEAIPELSICRIDEEKQEP